MATSILCRASLKTNTLFHAKFIDPLVSAEVITKQFSDKSNSLLAAVGLDVYGTMPDKKAHFVPVGCFFHSDLTSVEKTSPEFPLSALTYTFANETMNVDTGDFVLAILGSILENKANVISKELVETGTQNKLILPRKGIKIPGANFLPLETTFLNNIHPYLDGLSGVPKTCQKVFTDADLPYSKRAKPLSQLTNEEATQLTSALLPYLSAGTIPRILGSDYELPMENPASPMRYTSSIASLGQFIWSQKMMGLFLGILIGDRARQLSSLVERYIEYSNNTIKGVQNLSVVMNETESQILSSDLFVSISNLDIPDTTFADVGRILLETTLENKKFVVLRTSQSISIAWTKEFSLVPTMATFLERDIPLISTSSTSIRVLDSSDATHTKIMETIRHITTENVPS
ncbi:MAG: hypothetical protein P1Q69_01970 [Candidatus Thorarchaeota archaeon]|nr:hypothetical protein [Candidatus Thorarchaeota archaeon]